MKSLIDNTYWIAVAHLPRWPTERINRFIIQVVHEHKMTWADFFELDSKVWKETFGFSDKEINDVEVARNDLPRLAFIAEQLDSEGFQVIPVNSPDYPTVLKDNLKVKSSPPVIYIKGRKGLLQEEAVAIVGARKSGNLALEFTDHVAKKTVQEHKVVVSGFAKGVDKQALDSSIKYNGKSIIVLPQGILTFQAGFKKYYQPIINGDVLVLSTFFPKAGWEVGLAMARNVYIYGLAKEIYVAESDNKGGTWEGAIDGLKRKRRIYVRMPKQNEKNANKVLIDMGGIPVDMNGEIANTKNPLQYSIRDQELNIVNEPAGIYEVADKSKNIEREILDLLKKGSFSAKEIMLTLKLDWEGKKLSNFLKSNPNVKSLGGKPARFCISDSTAPSLFG
ncbi:DNA-processing protein DprA [Pseudoflavitalea sp. X16]|uniref:DNA-processing protein DprA n=1 Tax=Paraflavitalea devenefica TaxID=2716334 RepID=UPI00141E9C02|nr:DNA-processing protein DprA [Paraflavitalea devenefica]NII25901.1 DNA-processing protein DprA [Paraflavitalea devenefica]